MSNGDPPKKGIEGPVYIKSGHAVINVLGRPDKNGHIPTHRLSQASLTNKRPSESWVDYEDRVLARKTFGNIEKANSLDVLDPDVKSKVLELHIKAMQAGLKVSYNETHRTQERQEYLFQQGRSRRGDVITWTLTSDHTLSRAVDFHGSDKDLKKLREMGAEMGFSTLGDMDKGHLSYPKQVKANE